MEIKAIIVLTSLCKDVDGNIYLCELISGSPFRKDGLMWRMCHCPYWDLRPRTNSFDSIRLSAKWISKQLGYPVLYKKGSTFRWDDICRANGPSFIGFSFREKDLPRRLL